MQKKEYSIINLCDIQTRMKCANDSVWAVHEAMENGSCAVEDYLDALYGAYDYLRMLNKELAEAIEGMQANKKAVAV